MIRWNEIPPHFKWVAKDNSDDIYAYSHKPRKGRGGKYWVREHDPRSGSGVSVMKKVNDCVSMDDIPWDESLTERPGNNLTLEGIFKL